jgi:hypothetical protein
MKTYIALTPLDLRSAVMEFLRRRNYHIIEYNQENTGDVMIQVKLITEYPPPEPERITEIPE